VSNADFSFCRAAGDEGVRDRHSCTGVAPKVVAIGNCSGRDVEKFERFGLTPVPASACAASVAECFANLECKVADTRLVNKYNLFLLECSRHGSIRRRRIRRPSTIALRQIRCGWRDDPIEVEDAIAGTAGWSIR